MLHKIKYETGPYDVHSYYISYLEGKYAGVKVVLGAVKFVENVEQDNCTLKYNYDIIENPVEFTEQSQVKDFETFVSDVDTGLKVVDKEISQYAQQSFISKEDWNRINREFRTIEVNFTARIADIENAALRIV